MELDYSGTRPIAFLDFESQSETDLTTTHKYATHPSSRVLTCCVKVDGKMHRMGPYLRPDDWLFLADLAETHTICAHNAPFDAAVWKHCMKLPDAKWFDTLPCARAAGLPGKLDELGKLLTGQGKDPNGKRLIDMLCIIKRGRYPAVGPAHKLLLDYNERDVELLEQIYHRVKDYGEPNVIQLDRDINDRGIPVCRPYLQALLQLYDTNSDAARETFADLTGNVNPNSPKQMREWLRNCGFRVPVVRTHTGEEKESLGMMAVKNFLANTDEFYEGEDESEAAAAAEAVKEALDARKEVSRIGKSKATAAWEALEDDNRLRDQFVYYGAHTGRWASRGLQLHNMPKPLTDARDMEPTYENAKALAASASEKLGFKVYVADILNAMLRSMVRDENLLVADYAAVEARGIAWVSNESRMLSLYSDPHKSVYLDMGEALFSREISKKDDFQEYNMAKILVLGCGYGMSSAKFEYFCKTRNVSTTTFAKAGKAVGEGVKIYRNTYPRIPAVWKEYNTAMHMAIGGVPCEAGRCKFYMQGLDMHMQLPSGRCIVYRNAHIEQKIPSYCNLFGMDPKPVPTVVFDKPRGKGFLYGSRVAENAVQAICRDLIVEALKCCEQVGLPVVMHVHDEIVCSAPEERLPEFMEIMSTPPSWAKGFPLAAEGYSGPIWSKSSKGYRELNTHLGKEFK